MSPRSACAPVPGPSRAVAGADDRFFGARGAVACGIAPSPRERRACAEPALSTAPAIAAPARSSRTEASPCAVPAWTLPGPAFAHGSSCDTFALRHRRLLPACDHLKRIFARPRKECGPHVRRWRVAGAELERVDPESRAARHGDAPRRARATGSRARGTSSASRGRSAASGPGGERGCRVQARGDSQRAVECGGEVDLGAGRSHEHGIGDQMADPARANDLQADGVGDARGERRVRPRSRRRHAPATRSRTSRTRAARASAPPPARGRRGEVSIQRTASSTPQAPLASRRSFARGPAAARAAATRPASSPVPTFSFRHSKPS